MMSTRLLPALVLLFAWAPVADALDLGPADWTSADGGLTWTRPYSVATENHQSFCGREGLPTQTTFSCIPWPEGARAVVVEARDVSGESVRVFADFYEPWSTSYADTDTECSREDGPATLAPLVRPVRYVSHVDVYAMVGLEQEDCLPAMEGVLIVSFDSVE